MNFRFSFQASLPSSIRPLRVSLRVGRSCHGLCLLQDFGHVARASAWARPRTDHQPPETVSGPYPLMGLPTNKRTK